MWARWSNGNDEVLQCVKLGSIPAVAKKLINIMHRC